MKKILFILATFAALNSQGDLKAEGSYVQLIGGANWADAKDHWSKYKHDGIKADFKTGYLAGGAVGYQLYCGLKVEGEIAYRRNKINVSRRSRAENIFVKANAEARTWSVMGNLYCDLPFNILVLKPYIGGGVGYANNRANMHKMRDKNSKHSLKSYSREFSKNKTFAWQLIAGVALPLCESMDLDVEYRYFKPEKKVHSNDFVVGAKVHF